MVDPTEKLFQNFLSKMCLFVKRYGDHQTDRNLGNFFPTGPDLAFPGGTFKQNLSSCSVNADCHLFDLTHANPSTSTTWLQNRVFAQMGRNAKRRMLLKRRFKIAPLIDLRNKWGLTSLCTLTVSKAVPNYGKTTTTESTKAAASCRRIHHRRLFLL